MTAHIDAPECFRPIDRIPRDVWMNSQLSIARLYGGLTLGGEWYFIDYTDGSLVKDSILRTDRKRLAESERIKWQAIKEGQYDMFAAEKEAGR